MAKKSETLASYIHKDKARPNNPQVGLASYDSAQADKKTYRYDEHIDPQLDWAGKNEGTAFDVPTVSLHVHERIDAHRIIKIFRSDVNNGTAGQLPLFEEKRQNPPIDKALQFYQHEDAWTNRLISGDSLLVMNSLLEKEGMGENVQMIYIDPPYGITYGSNFQPFTDKRDVKDGQDLTKEPEQLRAFRDTWQLGIHSYLTYLRDRILLAKQLLNPKGSLFVQIGDENVHRVAHVLDEIFAAENRVATISYATTGGSSAQQLPDVANYILWYAKDKQQMTYHQLYEPLNRAEMIVFFARTAMVELADGTCRKLTSEERFDPDEYLPKGARLYRRTALDSQGVSTTGRSEPYEWNGRRFRCGKDRHWSISKEGLDRLAELNRFDAAEGEAASLHWKKYEDEIPGRKVNNLWHRQMPAHTGEKLYVVQTARRVIERCLLMTTDPGDLVFDPTCGGGTTAYVAEQWGRRWITCDTSRVATTLTKQRLVTASYEYYTLREPQRGVGGGFVYESVVNVSPRTLAYGEEAEPIVLYDRPQREKKIWRVTGPFTVEAVPAPVVHAPIDAHRDAIESAAEENTNDVDRNITRHGASIRQHEWSAELLQTGIRGKGNQRFHFAHLEPLATPIYLHADGVFKNQVTEQAEQDRIVVSFGPIDAPLDVLHVERALEEAQKLVPKPACIIFAAFQFDPQASQMIEEKIFPQVRLLKVLMNPDLLTDDLQKNKADNESFWLIGTPDIDVEPAQEPDSKKREDYIVTIRGFDYFSINNKTGKTDVISGGTDDIALWMLDTDYNGRSLYPRQLFLPTKQGRSDWKKLVKTLKGVIRPELKQYYESDKSYPFGLGDYKRIAVKIIDKRGIEMLRVIDMKDRGKGGLGG